MSDTARSSFNIQLTSVMESLLTAAVCEITKIFEGSLSESQLEIDKSREEVTCLKLQLEILEQQLKDLGGSEQSGKRKGQSPDLNAGLEQSAPVPENHVFTKGESGHQEGTGHPCTVKDEVEVTELESVSFCPEGAEVDRIQIKKEPVEENPEFLCMEMRGQENSSPSLLCLSGHLSPALQANAEALMEGTLRERVKLKPVDKKNPSEAHLSGLSVTRLGCVPRQPCLSQPDYSSVELSDPTPSVKEDIRNVAINGPHYSTQRGLQKESSKFPAVLDGASQAIPALCLLSSGSDSVCRNKLYCEIEQDKTSEVEHTQNICHRKKVKGDRGGLQGFMGVPSEEGPINVLRARYVTTHSISAQKKLQLTTSLNASDTLSGDLKGDRQNTCLEQRKTSVTKEKFKNHLNAHTRHKSTVCPYCGKAFTYPSQQRRHLLRHTGERQYPCTQCEKSFVTPSELDRHRRVHTGEKPYSCLQCGKRFNRNENLRAHQRDVHLGKRPFICTECGKTFAHKGNLRKHQQRLHQGKKPFPCFE